MTLALTVVGVIGNITSVCLFLSPFPTFYKILKLKSTEEFSSVPYVATLLNCFFWLFYGSPWVHWGLLIVTINGFGAIIEILYLLIFFLFARSSRIRVKTFAHTLFIIIFFGMVVLINMFAVPSKSTRKTIVGVFCVIIGTSMYISPLTVMRKVIKTKSTKYMPFFLSLFNFLNGITWTLYAIIAKDMFIAIPNGLGLLFAICQLVLYACYCTETPVSTSASGSGDSFDAHPDSVVPYTETVNVPDGTAGNKADRIVYIE